MQECVDASVGNKARDRAPIEPVCRAEGIDISSAGDARIPEMYAVIIGLGTVNVCNCVKNGLKKRNKIVHYNLINQFGVWS